MLQVHILQLQDVDWVHFSYSYIARLLWNLQKLQGINNSDDVEHQAQFLSGPKSNLTTLLPAFCQGNNNFPTRQFWFLSTVMATWVISPDLCFPVGLYIGTSDHTALSKDKPIRSTNYFSLQNKKSTYENKRRAWGFDLKHLCVVHIFDRFAVHVAWVTLPASKLHWPFWKPGATWPLMDGSEEILDPGKDRCKTNINQAGWSLSITQLGTQWGMDLPNEISYQIFPTGDCPMQWFSANA